MPPYSGRERIPNRITYSSGLTILSINSLITKRVEGFREGDDGTRQEGSSVNQATSPSRLYRNLIRVYEDSSDIDFPQLERTEYNDEYDQETNESLTQTVSLRNVMKLLKSVSSESEERLRSLMSLGNNWDGFGSPPPKREAVGKSALLLISATRLTRGEFGRPAISALPDGGIELEWVLNSGYELLIDIAPNGTFVDYLLVEPDDSGERESEGIIPKDSSLSELFQKMMR
jgi:hypothetical protein